ncbi:MAG: RNA methyltransferase [Methanobacteriota archaeon]|nr:MAG: RNA methyltransferase [Euryarchaeota archaeon]
MPRNIPTTIYRGGVPSIRIVLVEPKNEGNVGAVARSMKNFGAEELVLVKPCPLGAEARQRAMKGSEILAAARTVGDFESAFEEADFLVGTSGVDTPSEKRFARIAMTPRECASRISKLDGRVALVFGREDFGLLDEELRRCDMLVTIPASSDYPILNLSHAATILLYELFAAKALQRGMRNASGLEKEKLHEAFKALLVKTNYPAHKRARTQVMFRRLLGRAVPSKWEFHALMGVFQGATKRIQRLEGER